MKEIRDQGGEGAGEARQGFQVRCVGLGLCCKRGRQWKGECDRNGENESKGDSDTNVRLQVGLSYSSLSVSIVFFLQKITTNTASLSGVQPLRLRVQEDGNL